MKREKREVHQFKHKAGWNDKHHIKAKVRNGNSHPFNVLQIDAYKHDALHLLFGHKTLDEIIEFLTRLKNAKEKQKFHSYLNS
jgi:hypothetical protein